MESWRYKTSLCAASCFSVPPDRLLSMELSLEILTHTRFLLPHTMCPFLLFPEPTLAHVFALLSPDNLTLGFPTSKCSVWAALLSWDVQGHVRMGGRECTVLDSKYIHLHIVKEKRCRQVIKSCSHWTPTQMHWSINSIHHPELWSCQLVKPQHSEETPAQPGTDCMWSVYAT